MRGSDGLSLSSLKRVNISRDQAGRRRRSPDRLVGDDGLAWSREGPALAERGSYFAILRIAKHARFTRMRFYIYAVSRLHAYACFSHEIGELLVLRGHASFRMSNLTQVSLSRPS